MQPERAECFKMSFVYMHPVSLVDTNERGNGLSTYGMSCTYFNFYPLNYETVPVDVNSTQKAFVIELPLNAFREKLKSLSTILDLKHQRSFQSTCCLRGMTFRSNSVLRVTRPDWLGLKMPFLNPISFLNALCLASGGAGFSRLVHTHCPAADHRVRRGL